MTPPRHWRSYGNDPLPTGEEALAEPFSAFPSWFMRITCDRCGKDRMLSRDPRAAERPADPRDHQADAPDGCECQPSRRHGVQGFQEQANVGAAVRMEHPGQCRRGSSVAAVYSASNPRPCRSRSFAPQHPDRSVE